MTRGVGSHANPEHGIGLPGPSRRVAVGQEGCPLNRERVVNDFIWGECVNGESRKHYKKRTSLREEYLSKADHKEGCKLRGVRPSALMTHLPAIDKALDVLVWHDAVSS